MIALLAASFSLAPALDAWEIKPPFAAKAKTTWNITVDADADGGEHHATFKVTQNIDATDAKGSKGKLLWTDLEVDGNTMDGPPEMKLTLGPRGEVINVEGDHGDDDRRMMMVFFFTYPEKPVSVGDKWNFEFKPGKEGKSTLKSSFEALAVEKVKDAETLKIACKTSEPGDDGMVNDATFWVGKDGKPVKFELKIKRWIVPMAGSSAFDAVIKGEIGK